MTAQNVQTTATERKIDETASIRKQAQVHLDEILESVAQIRHLARTMREMTLDVDDIGTTSILFEQTAARIMAGHQALEKLVFDA